MSVQLRRSVVCTRLNSAQTSNFRLLPRDGQRRYLSERFVTRGNSAAGVGEKCSLRSARLSQAYIYIGRTCMFADC